MIGREADSVFTTEDVLVRSNVDTDARGSKRKHGVVETADRIDTAVPIPASVTPSPSKLDIAFARLIGRAWPFALQEPQRYSSEPDLPMVPYVDDCEIEMECPFGEIAFILERYKASELPPLAILGCDMNNIVQGFYGVFQDKTTINAL